ncbi:MAG: TonB-dependent receptor [Deltaproteobacteria bacterium]|nr:TonB-dependent receptor [Deltaproteobacteria bacterium]
MKRFIVLVIVLLLIPVGGYSQDTEKEKKKETKMDDIVVSAGRIDESKKDLTTDVIIIDKNDIENSTANDLADLLFQKAGIYVKKYPGTLSSPGIRGFKTDDHGHDNGEVLILIDGRRTGTGSAKIMTKNVERVEIIKGSAAIQYGASAIGGVINVITKRGKDKKELNFETKYGSYDFREISGSLSGKIGKFDLSFQASESKENSYKTGAHEKYENTGYDSLTNFSLNAGFEFIKGHRLGVIVSQFDQDKVGTPNKLSSNDPNDYKDVSNMSYDLSYEGQNSSGSLLWKIKEFKVIDKNNTYRVPANSVTITETDLIGSQGQFSYVSDDIVLTTGIDYQKYENTNSSNPKYYEYEDTAIFMLGKLFMFDHDLVINGGFRYDEHTLTYENQKNENENFCPSIGMGYFVTDVIKLRTNYSEAYSVPSGFQLFVDNDYSAFGWGTYLGNPNLKPESSKTYEGGIDLYFNENNISITYFRTNFKDKIISYEETTDNHRYKNSDRVKIEGIELSYSKRYENLFNQDLSVKPYFNGTLLTKYEDQEGNKLSQTADQTYSMGLMVSGFDGFNSDLNLHYTGRQEAYGSVKQKPYTVMNLSVSKRFMLNKAGGLTVKGEVKNISDADYDSVYGYPMSGRTIYMSLRYDF